MKTLTIDPITLAEALSLTIPASVRDSIPAIHAITPHVWAAWGRAIASRYNLLEAGPTVGDQRVRAAAEKLAEDTEDDPRADALERLRAAGVDTSLPEWAAASTETLTAHAMSHEAVGRLTVP